MTEQSPNLPEQHPIPRVLNFALQEQAFPELGYDNLLHVSDAVRESVPPIDVNRTTLFAREKGGQYEKNGLPLAALVSMRVNYDAIFNHSPKHKESTEKGTGSGKTEVNAVDLLSALYDLVPPTADEETKRNALYAASQSSRQLSNRGDITSDRYDFLVDYCKWEIEQAAATMAA